MSTIRAYNVNKTRIATAVHLKSGKVLQVYPRPNIPYTTLKDYATALAAQDLAHTFDSLEDWKMTMKDVCEYKTTTRTPRPAMKPRTSWAQKNRDAQIMEFFDKEYNWMFKSLEVKKVNDKPVIYATLCDNSSWTLYAPESLYYDPPRAFTQGREVTEFNNQYSPALTMVKWLMMLAFVKPVKR